MTVNNSANKVIAAGNGVQTVFGFSFVAVAASDLTVILTDSAGHATTLLPANYTVALSPVPAGQIWSLGGTVTYPLSGSPIPVGSTLTIVRELALTQLVSLSNQGNALPSATETALDLLEMQLQQVFELFQRSIVAPVVDSSAINLTLPPAAQRANTGLAFDSQGNVIAGTTPANGVISTAMQPVVSASSIALGQQAFGLTSIPILCTETFSINVYTLAAIAPNANPAAYANGQRFTFTATAIPSGPASAIVGALPPFGIYKGVGVQAGAGDISLGWSYTLEYSPTINSGAPGFLLLDTPPASQSLQPFFNVVAFGATGNGVTDDTAAIQAAINAAQVAGGQVLIPAGSYKITAALAITSMVTILGVGYQGDQINLLQSTGYKASVLVCGTNNGCFSIATNGSVLIEKLQIVYPSRPSAGIAAIFLDAAAGPTSFNAYSTFRDIHVIGADIGFKTGSATSYTVDRCNFQGCWNLSMDLKCINNPGAGDNNITGCTLSSSAVAAHILMESGGGQRIVNNKLNGGAIGIYILSAVATAFGMSPTIISDNSIETLNNNAFGILAQRPSGTEGLGAFVISGNEINIAGTSGQGIQFQASVSSPATPWIIGGTINGNYINATQTGMNVDGASGVVISANTITGATNGIIVGANTDHIRQSSNAFGTGVGISIPSVPTLPATGNIATNTNPYAVIVYVSAGTVSFISVNGLATGLVAGSFFLNPGDIIQLNYTVAPGFSVRAVNP